MENSSYSNIFHWYCLIIISNILGHCAKYFPVTMAPAHDPTMFEALLDGLVQDAADRDEEYEHLLDLVHESSLVTLTPWLRRTGWNKIFRGKNMKILSDLSLKPTAGEQELQLIWNGVGRVIENCYSGVKDCWDRGWTLIPFWLISAHKMEDSSRPFRMHFAESTIARYASYWQRFFMFCLRSLKDPESFGVEFHATQLHQLYELQAMVELDKFTNEALDEMVSLLYLLLIADFKSINRVY